MKKFLTITLSLSLGVGAGCAVNKQVADTSNPDGTKTHAVSITYVLWDASAAIAKNRASAGRTSSVGSVGVSEEASSSNLVSGLIVLGQIANTLRPPPAPAKP